MFINTLAREATSNILPGTAIGVALGSPPLQTALVNLGVAFLVRITSHFVTKRRVRRAARKAAANAKS